MMQVTINQTHGWIGIEQRPAVMRMKVGAPELKVNHRPGKFEISNNWPRVHIDMTETRASMGYKEMVRFQRDAAQKGKSTVLSGIGRVAAEGNMMGRIETGGSPYPALARAAWPEHEFNVALMPSVPPDIKATGSVNIRVKPADIDVESKIKFPQIRAEGGSVEIYLKTKPAIETEVSGQWINFLG